MIDLVKETTIKAITIPTLKHAKPMSWPSSPPAASPGICRLAMADIDPGDLRRLEGRSLSLQDQPALPYLGNVQLGPEQTS
jgi:hypothetical protein